MRGISVGLRAISAVLAGVLVGGVIWTVAEVVIHGVCGIPVLHNLWCTYAPGPGGSIGRDLDVFDILGLPFIIGVFIVGFWKVFVGGWTFREWLDN